MARLYEEHASGKSRTNQSTEGVDEDADPLVILERRETEAERDEMRTAMQIAFDAKGITADMFAISTEPTEQPIGFLDDLLERSPKDFN